MHRNGFPKLPVMWDKNWLYNLNLLLFEFSKFYLTLAWDWKLTLEVNIGLGLIKLSRHVRFEGTPQMAGSI